MKTNARPQQYAIAFIPDARTREIAIATSNSTGITPYEATSEEGTPLLRLDEVGYVPHLTLFQLMLDAGGVEACKRELDAIVVELGGYAGQLTGMASASWVLFWKAKKDLGIVGWHERVVKACEPYRKGQVRPPYPVHGKRADNLATKGYVYVGETYKPRMTLQRLDQRRARDLKEHVFNEETIPWAADKVVLARSDQMGRVPLSAIVHTIDLRSDA